jgi:aldose 1-epimerase
MRAQNYSADQVIDHGIPIVRLTDALREIQVSIAPSIGNRACELSVCGANALYFPFDNPAEIEGSRHLNGIPFLAPWANRMPEGFHANGKYYGFNKGLDSIRLDQNGIPIHGLLTASPFWQVAELAADAESAHATSRLEFWRHPDLMANWPFAHDYEMTYRLSGGVLEVSLTVINRSLEPMPLAVGFHPYFQLPGVAMDDAIARIPVLRHIETDSRLVATGETTPVNFGDRLPMKDHRFDDGFTGLIRGADGHAVFSIEDAAEKKKIEVTFGPAYQVAIVYAPPGQNYICFEPMTAVTNGVNLAHEGKYPELRVIAAGGRWQESFWIQPSHF